LGGGAKAWLIAAAGNGVTGIHARMQAALDLRAFHDANAVDAALRLAAESERFASEDLTSILDTAGLTLGDEFHHNRINVVSLQIFGVDPELTYRWNRARLVRRTMTLQAEGVLNLAPLVSHVLPFEAAAEAFELLDTRAAETLQVVLKTDEANS
jgi:hypothetical protein